MSGEVWQLPALEEADAIHELIKAYRKILFAGAPTPDQRFSLQILSYLDYLAMDALIDGRGHERQHAKARAARRTLLHAFCGGGTVEAVVQEIERHVPVPLAVRTALERDMDQLR